MQVTFLGTSCMKPTKERNPSAVFLSYKTEGILFDCGEGTQRQFVISGLKMTKITRVLLSHWHGDHVLGLAGLIATLGASDYTGTLHIYGPKDTSKRLALWFEAIPFDHRVEIQVHDIVKGGVFLETKDFLIEAQLLKHRIPCLGYAFQEKDKRRMNTDTLKKLSIPQGPLWGDLQDGKTITLKGKKITPEEVSTAIKGRRVVYITDTLLVENCYALAQDADLLICESPHSSALKDKAKEYMHLTSHDAGLIASRSNAKKLVLQHFSARYKNTQELEDDARDVFDNVITARDFLTLNL